MNHNTIIYFFLNALTNSWWEKDVDVDLRWRFWVLFLFLELGGCGVIVPLLPPRGVVGLLWTRGVVGVEFDNDPIRELLFWIRSDSLLILSLSISSLLNFTLSRWISFIWIRIEIRNSGKKIPPQFCFYWVVSFPQVFGGGWVASFLFEVYFLVKLSPSEALYLLFSFLWNQSNGSEVRCDFCSPSWN